MRRHNGPPVSPVSVDRPRATNATPLRVDARRVAGAGTSVRVSRDLSPLTAATAPSITALATAQAAAQAAALAPSTATLPSTQSASVPTDIHRVQKYL